VIPEPNFPARPDEFVGRSGPIEAFRQVLDQGRLAGRTPSFAVLGDWGVGKSSLLLKYFAICSGPEYAMLPVFFSVSAELSDYKRFAEGLLDTFTRALEISGSLENRLRSELQKWKLSKLSVGGASFERQGTELFLSSGTATLKHALHDAWRQFIRPAQLNGVIFFLDDLHNFVSPSAEGIALTLRDQFQEFAVHGLNYSLCFSARADYFSEIRHFAEPAVRFYEKAYLASFTRAETQEYAAAVFGDSAPIHQVSEWLYGKTLGHPYFLAFISRQLLTLGQGTLSHPELLWPVIFSRLEHEKFRSDLANVTEKEAQLLRDVATAQNGEIRPSELSSPYDRNYFKRLTEKVLLLRVGRGRYKLYHPLFRQFLQQRE
jgi:AAA ATPase domain